jgi:phosphoribosylanthranilate isomerase
VTRVKICGVRELEHALAALDAGADLLGFVFYRPSHRYLTPEQARELIASVRRERDRSWLAVGLFVNEPPGFVERVVRDCALDLAQLSGDEDRAYCAAMTVPFLKVERPIRAGNAADLARSAAPATWGATRVLLDAAVAGRYGGTGEALDWAALSDVASDCILAGGLTPANVAQAVAAARPWGVDVSSGVERDKRKDSGLIRVFIAEVQRADEQYAIRIGA